MTKPTRQEARLLNGTHIGEMVCFTMLDSARNIQTVVTAELRQIYHNTAEVVVHVGNLAEVEYALSLGQLVEVGVDDPFPF